MGSPYQQQASFYDDAYDPQAAMMTEGYAAHSTPRNRGNSVMNGEASVALSTIVPGWAHPTPEQLDTAMEKASALGF